MRNSTSVILVLFVCVAAGVVIYGIRQWGEPLLPLKEDFVAASEECVESRAFIAGKQLPPVSPILRAVPEGFERYRNEEFRFSLFYPSGFVVAEFVEQGGGITVTFERRDSQEGFQVFVLPYQLSRVTKERLESDTRTGVVENVSTAPVDGICAIAFNSRSILIGDTQEIWVINNGFLYEITTFKMQSALITDVVDSWRFL